MILANAFLAGAFTLAAVAVALHYLRYWRQTSDRLFAALGVAFLLLAIERAVLAFVPPQLEGRHWIFLVRLIAFALILVGIADKNRPRRRTQ